MLNSIIEFEQVYVLRIEQAIGQVGEFLGKKENWDAMLDVASRIVNLVLMFK